MRRLIFPLLLAALAAPAPAAPLLPLSRLPLAQHGGSWRSGHVQGIAVDLAGGFIYYSFTNLLAKYDFDGKLVGTLVGWTGHLGDLDINPADGKIYGSLEYKKDKAFYVAVIDGARINRVGIEASRTDILRMVYLAEVTRDYSADVNGDGRFDGDDGRFRGDVAASPDHRYGCSGIDGIAFGPAFGRTGGRHYLTVAYGIYGNLGRSDNDHQILLQYDVSGWARFARPLSEAAPHRRGPASPRGKYFVRTGNTRYGVQNLSYDPASKRWFLGVYPGGKPAFPNYGLFAVEAAARPAFASLVGVPSRRGKGWERGLLLPLADAGRRMNGISGWHHKADVGSQPVGSGLFYFAENSSSGGFQSADLRLMRWTGSADTPFVQATAADLRQLAK